MKPVIAVFITGMFFVATLLAGNDANPDAIDLGTSGVGSLEICNF